MQNAQGLSGHDKLYGFLESFRAADLRFQEWCVNAMSGEDKGASQYTQDIFVWRNLFLDNTISGRRGIYVDSGANDYRQLSNTFFFDECLGWHGVCIPHY